jgi:hypothetical protein
MPTWLRRTEIAAAIVGGLSGAFLGYSKLVTILAVMLVFALIEAGWFAYRIQRGIPDA